MSRRRFRVALFVAVASALAWTGRTAAVAPTVHDGGEFFSADAVKKANEQIRELYRKYQRDLLVETFKSPPADMVEKVKNMSTEDRNKFYEKWAKDRCEAEAVNGIYILITKEPPHLQIDVTPRFTGVVDSSARNRLLKMMMNDLRDKNFDAGLDEAIKFMRVKLEDQNKNKK